MPDLRSIVMTTELFDYIVSHSSSDPIYDRIREDTLKYAAPRAGMQIGADQFALLTLLTRLVDARFAVEVGTFTGTSAAAIAKGLAAGGKLLCCDISEEWTSIARNHWEQAGISDRIELRIAPALETISALPADQAVDLVFIDADKSGYVDYYEALMPRLRPGGLLIADNTLWSGRVADPQVTDSETEAIRRFNDQVARDDRSDVVILAIGDGVTLCLKR
ncbi:MAG: O-methyltransferase [Acidimicrobiia bacterium]